MRTLLVAALLLAVAGCDSTPTGGQPDPDPEYVGVLVTYRLTLVGSSFSVGITYTDEEGDIVTDVTDFSRQQTYTQEVLLPPGTSGTFSLSGTGIVNAGSLTASITATRVDTDVEVRSATETASTSSSGEEATVSASITVAPVEVPAPL